MHHNTLVCFTFSADFFANSGSISAFFQGLKIPIRNSNFGRLGFSWPAEKCRIEAVRAKR
jgi:hypothetical protein